MSEEPDDAPQPVFAQNSTDPDEMASDYLPEAEDWLAKTQLDLTDPHAVAALSQFDQMFPEVDDLQPMLDDFIIRFLKGRTSVGGDSRDEYKDILQSMYGGSQDDAKRSFDTLVAGDIDDD